MEVIVGKTSGFCFGVDNAVCGAQKVLNENENVYCLGEIIHNEQVIKSLEDCGMITVDNLNDIPEGEKVIFRAHGEAKIVYNMAKKRNLQVFDFTCPKVKAIHIKVEREKEKSFIIIVGKKNHPEIIGTKGFAGENSYVIESEDDILDAYMEYEKTNLGRVYVFSQTTFSSSKFDKIVEEIQLNFYEADVFVDKTICDSTENRQQETRELSKKVNKMIIIGGKNSSNTKELAKVAEENCNQVYLVQTVDDLKGVEFSVEDKIGIMAGASTPQESIEQIVDFLKFRDVL